MTEHAPTPRVCDECLAEALKSCPERGGRLVWLWCGHGPDPGAMLRVEFQGGRAVEYLMQGPMDEAAFERHQAAEQLAAEALEARRPPGGRDN